MSVFFEAAEKIAGAFWGLPALVLFVGGGLYASVRLKFVQFRFLGRAFRETLKGSEQNSAGPTPIEALAASLGAVMGPGNIVGVSSAILLGGAGAVFWMWVSAWLGMALRFAESFRAVKYRIERNGERRGGAMYIFRAKKMPVMAALFAGAGVIVSLTMADAVPASALGNALAEAWKIPPFVTGAVMTVFTAAVVFGGAKRITGAAQITVPVLCIFYALLTGAAIVCRPAAAAGALAEIFSGAFSLRAGVGGLLGGALRYGLSKGVFSHEAGMGTDPLLAASTSENDAFRQALVSMTGPFLDTIVFCSLTAIAVLTAQNVGTDPASMARKAFSEFFPGFGGWAADVTLALLVLATLSSWAFYGEVCVKYFSDRKLFVNLYRGIYCAVPLISAGSELSKLLVIGDLTTALMAVPNVILCILLICEVKTAEERRLIGTSSVDKMCGKGYHNYTEKL